MLWPRSTTKNNNEPNKKLVDAYERLNNKRIR